MYLTLEVVSPQAASLGTERRRVVGPAGLTIGRMPGNDWVFPDPYVSKQHARISYTDGAFFVEGLGRNAIALGHAGNTLPGHQPQPLKNGDRLFIDQYEIVVTAMQGDAPAGPIPGGAVSAADLDPFAVLADNATPGRGVITQPGSQSNSAWPDALSGLVETDVLDPLKAIGGGPPPRKPEGLPPVDWNRNSVLEDHFAPPPVPQSRSGSRPVDLLDPAQPAAAMPDAGPRGPGSAIPVNWDKTNFTRMQAEAAARAPSRPAPGGARNIARGAPVARAAPGARVPVRDTQPVPRTVAVPGSSRPMAPQAPSPPAPVAASASAPVPAPPPTQQTDFMQFMQGAGLSDKQLAPETMRELGEVFRIVVQGVMDVLRARADIKSQFRMPMTRIQATENNPLKHAPNVESALNILLVQRNPGYLGTRQAFEDAFADIRAHQMAMLEGVRLAYESMLKRFDPKELEAMFERSGKRTRGLVGGKSKFWDLYAQHFAELGSDPEDMFRNLFGNDFAEAYERQLERLKSLEVKNGKN